MEQDPKRCRTVKSDIEIPIKNKIPKQTEDEYESLLAGSRSRWRNLSFLQTLEQYDVSQRKKRGEMITKVVREFFLTPQEEQVQLIPEENTNEYDKSQVEWQNENPTAKALRNPLVIKMIIGHLKSSSILKCRLVNKLWLQLCMERLSKSRDEDEDALRIKFRYCDETGTYIKYFPGILRGKIKTLDCFNHFLSQMDDSARSRFPCLNFELNDVNLRRFTIKTFFQLLGSKIKGLRIGFSDKRADSVNTESFTELFMSKVPNVECLTIFEISSHWDYSLGRQTESQILNISNDNNEEKSENEASDLPIFSLRFLRCLRIQLRNLSSEGLLRLEKEIILSSPALKTVHVKGHSTLFSDSAFDFLTSISKGHLISHADIRPDLNQMDILTTFVQSQPPPKFKHLSLSLEFVEVSPNGYGLEKSISFEDFLPSASALLNSSQNTLKSFSMPEGKCALRFLKMKEFPPLKKVKKVSLYCKEKREKNGWPIPIKQFNRIFPAAKKLVLMGRTDSKTGGFISWPEPEPTPAPSGKEEAEVGTNKCEKRETEAGFGVIPQIKSLTVYSTFSRKFMNNLPLIFCNVVELDLQNKNLLPILPLIWNFKSLHLKKLKLHIVCRTNHSIQNNPNTNVVPSPATIFPGLDAALTGFPEDACVELLSLHPKIVDEETVKEIRINSSILDLKYLEELHIKFRLSKVDQLPENILTVVSGAYAFQRMRPKVQIHIETQVRPKYLQTTSALGSRNQQNEEVLKPLLPYADNFTYTLPKTPNFF